MKLCRVFTLAGLVFVMLATQPMVVEMASGLHADPSSLAPAEMAFGLHADPNSLAPVETAFGLDADPNSLAPERGEAVC